MITISLCMIVKNESGVLGRCLDSIKDLVDEIIVVDTGSEDDTIDVARKRGAKIFSYPWRDNFSAARNFSFSKAAMDYILWLDADDVLEPEDREKFRNLKEVLSSDISVVNMLYNAGFDRKGKVTFSYRRERLLRRRDNFQWQGAVHEAITPRGKVLDTDIAITHRKEGAGDPDRNLRIYEKQIAMGKTLEPREKFYYGRELMFHNLWSQAIRVLEDFLVTPGAWLENQVSACLDLSRCYQSIGDERGEIESLLKSLSYDEPRAELCCAIGSWWLRHSGWRQSEFWYRTALDCDAQAHPGAFVSLACYDYIPNIQLAVIYDKLGRLAEAAAANEAAGKVRPDDPSYLHNKAYFDNKLKEAEKK